MNWYYYDKNGEKIAVTGKQLKEFAQQGIVTPETVVETGEGKTSQAGKVKGLVFAKTKQSEVVKPIETEIYGLTSPTPMPLVKSKSFSATPATSKRSSPVPASPQTQVPVPPTRSSTVNSFCTNCGNPVSQEAFACMSCGAKPIGHRKFCRHCGSGVNPEQVVCVKCGTGISVIDASQSIGSIVTNLQAYGFGASEITVLAATILSIVSFLLPWAAMTLPIVGRVSASGIQKETYWLGIVFIYPACMVLARKKINQIGGHICGGIGLLLGIIYLMDCRKELEQFGADKAISVNIAGIGAYLFICTCIALMVGIELQRRANKRKREKP